MAKETVEKVKNAELMAEQTEQEAITKAREIISEAETDGRNLLKEAVLAAEEEANANRAKAEKQAVQLMQKAKEQAEFDSKELFDNSVKKKDTVIAAIISSLV